MAINPSLLVSAAMLQDPFISKTAIPLANGVIYAFSETNRLLFKNWYYQVGNQPPYTYAALPNPMTLSAAGTIVDVNGNDVIPFYYPFQESNALPNNYTPENYYFEVYDQFGTLQFTRANFPFGLGSGNIPVPTNTGLSLQNNIINNRFWRNFGGISVDTMTGLPNSFTSQYNNTGSSFPYVTIAPSEHDGFSMPDINYIKNVNGATETITVSTFLPANAPYLTNDITPEYYINHNCTVLQAGETLKVYQFPISLHTATLANVPFTVTIQAQSISGASTMQLFLYQFAGTGSASPAPVLIQAATLQLLPTWKKFDLTGVFPNSVGLTLSAASDDAFYLQIGMPLSTTFELNFTLPSLYLNTSTIPTNDWASYDDIDAVISSPRTGDIRTSLNSFYPYGWVPMNDGSIGSSASVASTRRNADTWPLFNLIWNSFSAFNSGSSNILAQMFDSAGIVTSYGASAIADFTANKSISLTKLMGKVLLGTVPIASLLTPWSTTFTAAANVITTTNNVSFFNGMPIYITGGSIPAALSANTIYYVANFTGTNAFNLSSTFANAMSGTIIAFGLGSGNIISQLAGSFEGEYAHTQLTTELATHNHTGTAPISALGVTVAGGVSNLALYTSTTPLTINNTGSSAPFNVTQPGSFYNMFIKL